MAVNRDKPDRWKQDIRTSVDLYNDWFLRFAPQTFRDERERAIAAVEEMLSRTRQLRDITSGELRNHPGILSALRMVTAPPIARDRLAGLADVPKGLVKSLESEQRLPPRMPSHTLDAYLRTICQMILRLVDVDIFPWLAEQRDPSADEIYRAATIVADRLCGASADPIIRNAQEQRQLQKIGEWLLKREYTNVTGQVTLEMLRPGEFAFRLCVTGMKEDLSLVNIPVDTVVMPLQVKPGQLPLLIEAKSAGDFTNTNKRRKEEVTKVGQLRKQYGSRVQYILFLCGYFDSGYLGYEAAEQIDWVWEHRMDDLALFGLLP